MKNPISTITLVICIIISTNFSNKILAQYAPPAGQPGTTAIHADSNIFVDWANECTIERGLIDISVSSYGYASFGFDDFGSSKADNAVVSLGDGGEAILSFNVPISDGPGWDFAVFENSFSDDFLELAFVEVSSNGVNYHRFNSISLTQQEEQIETFGFIDAGKIHNLAGKYRTMFGVPFDLSELKHIEGLDLTNIISIKIIDVVGCINDEYGTYDSEGSIINDPWPTPFESGGFDLDAVGVIHNRNNTSVTEVLKNAGGIIFPNPVVNYFEIAISEEISKVTITDLSGKLMSEYIKPSNDYFDAKLLPEGVYIVSIASGNCLYTVKLIKQ